LIIGLVERPYNLSYSELLEMPSTVIEAELYCVDGPNRPVVQGKWRGVALRAILEKAGLKEGVVKIAFYASDGFSSDLALEDVLSPDIILAYELNGERMQGTMGAPVNRLVVPGRWGYKWVAGVERIEVVDYDFLGTWEGQGYPDKALIAPPPPAPSSPDPGMYLAFGIMALVALVAGKQYLRQRNLKNDLST
jgi:DMSO/TMAO reductase YedYZ molybdopterin-dependent catalytic subunit